MPKFTGGRGKPPKGTPNRSEGKLDYTLPSPWSDTYFIPSSVDIAQLPTLADGTPYLPLNILNSRIGEDGNDDDDGFYYDVLEWDTEANSSIGFEQEVYIFREAAPNPPGSLNGVQAEIRLKLGSPIKAATILIEDYNSSPVQLGNDLAEQLIDSEGSGAIAAGGNNNVLIGLEGFDVLIGGAGNDFINGGSDNDILSGGAGNDEIYGEDNSKDDPLNGRPQEDRLNGGAGNDRLYGGSGTDSLSGGTEDDILYGGSGDDTLGGEAGNDVLYGGTGDDTYVVNDLNDRLVEMANEGKDEVQSFVSHTLAANLENLSLIGAYAIAGIGNELDNNIFADPGSLTSVNNFIDALDGNDTVDANGGEDVIYGGNGDDTINGGEGDDVLLGDDGNDTLNGGGGDDVLLGGDGNDTLDSGFDFGNDTLDGGSGNDLLKARFGEDQLTGGAGADVFVAFKSTNSNLSSGVDRITDFQSLEGDKVRVYTDELGITVGDYSKFSYFKATGAVFFGIGPDRKQLLSLKRGTNFVPEEDIVIVDRSPFDPSQPFQPPDAANDIPLVGRLVVGTAGSDRLSGDEGNDTLLGLAGADSLYGQEGDDSLNGGADADLLNGGSGRDRLQGELGNDILFGEAGDDTLEGGGGSDTLTGGTGNDTLTGGTGTDRFNFYTPTGVDRITDFNSAEDKIGLYVGNKNITTAFRAAGFVANVAIAANQFHIGIVAATDSDRLIYDSSTGALFFDVDGTGSAIQVQIAGLPTGLALTNTSILAFDDTNSIATPTRTIGTNFKDTLTGTSDDERLLGLGGNDAIDGGDGNDYLLGGKGNDYLFGRKGSDRLIGGNGNDYLFGGKGSDRLIGGNGNDYLLGRRGSDRLIGGNGNDYLLGGKGSDYLFGGKGSDRLIGGRGSDLFVLGKGLGRDIIRDFQARQDQLGLSTRLKFNQLSITQYGHDTLIALGDDQLALLINVRKNQITKANFALA